MLTKGDKQVTSRRTIVALIAAAMLGCGVFVPPALAAIITYTTPANSPAPGDATLKVSAKAVFITGTGTVDIVLSNLFANLRSEQQALTDLKFTLSTGQTSGTLSSSETVMRTVTQVGKGKAATNVFSDGATIIGTDWVLANNVGGGLHLDGLAAAPPKHTLIGPPDPGGAYSNANSSITNDPHKDHYGGVFASDPRFTTPGVAIFHLLVPGVTSTSTILSAIFSFNTDPGSEVVGGCTGVCTHTTGQAPLPGTALLLGAGLALAGVREGARRLLRKR